MRIGIDCRTILNPQAGEKAGIAHYTYYLVKNLLKIDKLDEFVLFFDYQAKHIVREFLEPNTTIRFFSFSRHKKFLPFFYSHLLSAWTVDAEKLDVFHSPANVVPIRYGGKFCVTIHDLAIYRRPDLFPSRQGFSVKYLVPRTINRASKVIAVSQSTKRDVEKFFHVASEKIEVIHEGVDLDQFKPKASITSENLSVRNHYKIKRDYILFLGTLEPRKNLIRLLEAYYFFHRRNPELAKKYQLVLAGAKGWLYDSIFEEVKSRELSEHVVFPGYLPASDVPALLASATIFVYPSLYEGFGLPVLEAMAAGVPVITSNISSLPEITDSAALLVDPADTEGLSKSMEKLLLDASLARQLSESGRQRALNFTWTKCAEKTLQVYKSIV